MARDRPFSKKETIVEEGKAIEDRTKVEGENFRYVVITKKISEDPRDKNKGMYETSVYDLEMFEKYKKENTPIPDGERLGFVMATSSLEAKLNHLTYCKRYDKLNREYAFDVRLHKYIPRN